jgi:hypothetical protein
MLPDPYCGFWGIFSPSDPTTSMSLNPQPSALALQLPLSHCPSSSLNEIFEDKQFSIHYPHSSGAKTLSFQGRGVAAQITV